VQLAARAQSGVWVEVPRVRVRALQAAVGGGVMFTPPLYISLVTIHSKRTGGPCENDFTARGHLQVAVAGGREAVRAAEIPAEGWPGSGVKLRPLVGFPSQNARGPSRAIRAREKQIGGSGGSLEPPGPLLEPLGLFLCTSILFKWRILRSAILPA
jgi:hypothetical protein